MFPWATDEPDHTFVDKVLFKGARCTMRPWGRKGAEYLTRYHKAKRFEAGRGASCIDYFQPRSDSWYRNERWLRVCFSRWADRRPMSMTSMSRSAIVQGQATWHCGGTRVHARRLWPRRSSRAAAVHYFMNRSNAPMAMVWGLRRGPQPARLVRGGAMQHGGRKSLAIGECSRIGSGNGLFFGVDGLPSGLGRTSGKHGPIPFSFTDP